MTDVYAQMGIPLPKSKDLDSDSAFAKEEPEDDAPRPKQAWEIAQERDVRLECLKLVVAGGCRSDKYAVESEKLFQYVTLGLVTPLTNHTIFCGSCLYNEIVDTAEQADEAMRRHMSMRHPEIHKKLYGS